jgi:uncharacterized protein YjbJ (UPF0337 family)
MSLEDKISGTAKEAEGKFTGDKSREAEGKLEQAKGEGKDALGNLKDAADDLMDRARDEVAAGRGANDPREPERR